MGHLKKKTAPASEQDREDVRARRKAWLTLQPDLGPARLMDASIYLGNFGSKAFGDG